MNQTVVFQRNLSISIDLISQCLEIITVVANTEVAFQNTLSKRVAMVKNFIKSKDDLNK